MSNFNFNLAVLGGRLTKDPELKMTQQGTPVCSFTVAVNRKTKDKQTDFINCIAWKERAEFISKYFKKGSAISVTGSIATRSWDGSDGQKHYATEIAVNSADFVDSAAESNTSPTSAGNTAGGTNTAPAQKAAYNPYDDLDDRLPF